MKKLQTFLLLLSLILMPLSANAEDVILKIAPPGTDISKITDTYLMDSGSITSPFDMDIYIEGITDFTGYSFVLNFDPEVLSADSLSKGDFLGSTGRTVEYLVDSIDNTAGKITLTAGASGMQDAPDRAGVLATIKFTLKNKDTDCDIVFSGTTISDINSPPFLDHTAINSKITSFPTVLLEGGIVDGSKPVVSFSNITAFGNTLLMDVIISNEPVVTIDGYVLRLAYDSTKLSAPAWDISGTLSENKEFKCGKISEGELSAYVMSGLSTTDSGTLLHLSFDMSSMKTGDTTSLSFKEPNGKTVLFGSGFTQSNAVFNGITITRPPIPDPICAITISTSGSGKIVMANDGSTPPSTYKCGETVTFKAVPEDGQKIEKITADGSSVTFSDSGTFSFTPSGSDHIIAAVFVPIPESGDPNPEPGDSINPLDTYTITTSAEDGVNISPSGVSKYSSGSSAEFEIQFNCTLAEGVSPDNLEFITVDGAVKTITPVDGVYTYRFENITGNHTIHAALPDECDSIDPGINGKVECNGTTCTITPNKGYKIKDVQINGESVIDQLMIYETGTGTLQWTGASDDINVSFVPITYTITPIVGEGGSIELSGDIGSIDLSGNIQVAYGAKPVFTITPEACYQLHKLLLDGKLVTELYGKSLTELLEYEGGVAKFTFPEVTQDYQLEVVFALKTYTVSISAGEGGSIDPSGDIQVACGAKPVVTITPDDCYRVDKVLLDGEPVMESLEYEGETVKYTFPEVTQDHQLEIVFALKTYLVTVSVEGEGDVSPKGEQTVNCGADFSCEITPNSGWQIKDVFLSGYSVKEQLEQDGETSRFVLKDVRQDYLVNVVFQKEGCDPLPVPVISGEPPASVTARDFYTFTPEASAPEGGTLSFTIVNQPKWATIDLETGTLEGTPGDEHVGTYGGIVITVQDECARTASLPEFEIIVEPQPVEPQPGGGGGGGCFIDSLLK